MEEPLKIKDKSCMSCLKFSSPVAGHCWAHYPGRARAIWALPRLGSQATAFDGKKKHPLSWEAFLTGLWPICYQEEKLLWKNNNNVQNILNSAHFFSSSQIKGLIYPWLYFVVNEERWTFKEILRLTKVCLACCRGVCVCPCDYREVRRCLLELCIQGKVFQ